MYAGIAKGSSNAHCKNRLKGKRYITTSQAAPVPTIALKSPVLTINNKEFPKYRGKVVEIRCSQMLSLGVKAIQPTAKIGARTKTAINSAPVDQMSGTRRKFFTLI